ncbi:MAG: carbamoyltransferase C-terminal domain-containing protein [Candidatus Woesearchaeota archaeon]|nr:carbamoyltransferase C-terminal domain-containing protein [Candidatus Woesearchaeota archaeon]
MNILGINYGHDASVCLLRDDKVEYAITEERITRIKHQAGFPIESIKEVLKRIKPEEIDYIALAWFGPVKNFTTLFTSAYWRKVAVYKRPFKLLPPWTTINEVKILRKLGIQCPVKYIEHHIAHQFSSIAQSGFKKCLSISIDGWGDGKSYYSALWENEELKYIAHNDRFSSLGSFYSMATLLCGFESNEGEGKTMGLAPYGKPTLLKTFEKVIAYKNLKFYTPERLFRFYAKMKGYQFELMPDSKILEVTKNVKKEDIAASAQTHAENLVLQLSQDLKDQYGLKKFALSGGFFLNCVTNGKILSDLKLDELFIQPHAGDGGLALGAAYKVYHELTGQLPEKQVDQVYYGNEFTDEEIKTAIKKYNLKYEAADTGEVAELLSKGKIVGWFQGKDEWGPRALGNRSILGDPRRAENKDIINNKVKHREPWRPFCPSLLEEAGPQYLKDYHRCPFMTINFSVLKDNIPAATHIDKTARPQIVSRQQNPKYYELINEFKKITKVPVLINTSFNLQGEPMVHRPEEAIADYLKTEMDVLVLGNFLMKKRK